MGLKVGIRAFLDVGVLAFAVLLTFHAIMGKLACGAGGWVRGINRVAGGCGMIPRGEVGFSFAGIGPTLVIKGHPVVSAAICSGVAIRVMVATLMTPVLLKGRLGADESGAEDREA